MGPVMNLALAVVLLAVVLYQGAEVPVYQDQPPVVGAVTPDSPAAKADIRPRRPRAHRRRPAGRDVGAILHRGRHAAEPRSHDHAEPPGQRARAPGDAGHRARQQIRDRRHRRLARRASQRAARHGRRAGRQGGHQAGRRHPRDQRRADRAPVAARSGSSDAIPASPSRSPCAARASAATSPSTPITGLRRGRRRSGLHRRRARRGNEEDSARRLPGGRDERRAATSR